MIELFKYKAIESLKLNMRNYLRRKSLKIFSEVYLLT